MIATGCVPDLVDHVVEDLLERPLVGSVPADLPRELDVSALRARVYDQGGSESCVGQAFATSLYVLAQRQGAPIAEPSAKAIWDLARLVDTPNHLENVGCRFRAALVGMQEYGLVAATRWPLTDENYNAKPPLDVFEAADGSTLRDWYRFAAGVGSATLARVAMAKGHVPVFSMPVDLPFALISDGTIYEGMTEDERGKHAMALVGYGDGYLLISNSWGRGWGVNGVGRISDAAFERHCLDIICPTLGPREVT